MNYLDMIENMPESVYQSLVQAVELGRWANGDLLSVEQKETTLQAVLAWQAKHLDSDQHLTVGKDGQLVEKSREALKKSFADNSIIRFKHDDI
ncbi:YeaC family protein [Catenovulum sediminis]|uniref:DUF1315 family protein n=1 Tax=Catenovulum sediminis TaxID=1740262 RepID=A0ABV1RL96_9ALTE|nr:DUF1315 family protein [Catenovulum sediminis]